MRKRTLAATIAAVAATAGLIAPSPGYALASDCPSDYFCVWINYDYLGGRWQASKTQFVNAYHNGIHLPTGFNNAGKSFYNHLIGSSWQVNIYDSANCFQGPWYRTMQAGQKATAQGSDWGNRVSSVQLSSASPLTC